MKASKYRHKWWALLGVSLLAFTAFLDSTIVNTALPFIQSELQVDILQLQWVANIFTVILSMTMIAVGKFADLWGRKKVFYIGVALFAIAAFGAGISPNIDWLVCFRGLQALGASIVFIASASLLTDVFPEKERVRAISLYGGVTGFGLMIGPFLGGVLIASLSWRWVFWINLPLIGAGLLACSFSLKNIVQERHTVRIDWAGLSLLIFGLGSLMYGIIDSAQSGWSSFRGWIFLGTGALALIGLIILDEIKKNALLDLHIFKEKIITLGALSCSLAGVASTVFMFFDPLYLRIVRNLSPFLIGLLIATIPAAQSLISLVFNRAVKRFGVANLLFFSTFAALLAILLHLAIEIDTPLYFLVLPFFFLGINWGLSNAASITGVNLVIAPTKIGAAIGTIATIWNLVGSLILAISTAIFHSVELKSSFLPAFHRTVGFNIAFAALISVMSFWTWLRLKKK